MSRDVSPPAIMAYVMGTPVYQSHLVPLEQTTEDGVTRDVLFVALTGCILVHPARWPQFTESLERKPRPVLHSEGPFR